MKCSIILIDDDHGPMEYYVEALQIRGFAVKQIDAVDDAFSWLENTDTQPPDLIVIDMMLPPQNRLTVEETNGGLQSGVLLAEAIRKKWPEMPMIALTNHNDPDVINLLPKNTDAKAKFDISPFAFADFVKQTLQV